MSGSPTTRTLAKLRADGWLCAIVEKWNPHANIRQDMFGFIDILAIRGSKTLAVQTTSYANVSSRVNKIANSEFVGTVRDAGWGIVVHGWHKKKWYKQDGSAAKLKRWECRVVDCS